MLNIITEIEDKIHKIKKYSQHMESAKKIDEQIKIKEHLSREIDNIDKIVNQLYLTVNNSNFICSDNIKFSLKSILENGSNLIENNNVTLDKIVPIRSKIRNIQDTIANEWSIYYNGEIKEINEVLDLAMKFSNFDINSISKDILAAKDWNENRDVNKVVTMMRSIEKANLIIEKLDLNDNILIFLRKVIQRRACIDDLTEEVITWIKKEKLENRIKITF